MAATDELQKSIETVDEWLHIAGDEPQKDMLFVVEVYAAWCGPSQAAISTYKKIKDANEQKKFKLCKVCAALGVEIAEREKTNPLEKWHIQPRPTFLLYKEGELVGAVEGVSMPTLERLISEHMPEGLMEDEEEVAEEDNEEDA